MGGSERGPIMSLKLALTFAACLSMTACTTIDLNQVATKSPTAKSSAVEFNVVQSAASKLYTAFTKKGFVAKTSRKRMQSAASILLKGLQDKDVNSDANTGYAALAIDASAVRADIHMASGHVEQTTKAAEIYLVMAAADRSLRKELASLEKALLASREAEQVFEEALVKTSASKTAAELVAFKASVDALRDVTNAFGDQVREAQTTQVAAF